MEVIDLSTTITSPPIEVFNYVSDADRLPEWQPSVESAGFDGPSERMVGMRGHERRRTPGGLQDIQWEVTKCEPGVLWAIRGVNGPVRAHVQIDLSPADGGGTQLGYRMQLEGVGPGEHMLPMAAQGARDEAPEMLARLKQRLETVNA